MSLFCVVFGCNPFLFLGGTQTLVSCLKGMNETGNRYVLHSKVSILLVFNNENLSNKGMVLRRVMKFSYYNIRY